MIDVVDRMFATWNVHNEETVVEILWGAITLDTLNMGDRRFKGICGELF